MYGYICPECGCYLDPGEKCDCKDEERMFERFGLQQGRRACVSIVRLWKASARNWMNRLMLENVEWYRFLRHIRDAGVC